MSSFNVDTATSPSSANKTENLAVKLDDVLSHLTEMFGSPSQNDLVVDHPLVAAFTKNVEILKDATSGNASLNLSLKRALSAFQVGIPAEYQEEFEDPESASDYHYHYGPQYDQSLPAKYHPITVDGQGRPRNATPPPPELPFYVPREVRVEYPDGSVYHLPFVDAVEKKRQIACAREEAILSGKSMRYIPPPHEVIRTFPGEIMEVDTPQGPWHLPPDVGAQYKKDLLVWAQATHAQREQDGIIERVDADWHTKVPAASSPNRREEEQDAQAQAYTAASLKNELKPASGSRKRTREEASMSEEPETPPSPSKKLRIHLPSLRMKPETGSVHIPTNSLKRTREQTEEGETETSALSKKARTTKPLPPPIRTQNLSPAPESSIRVSGFTEPMSPLTPLADSAPSSPVLMTPRRPAHLSHSPAEPSRRSARIAERRVLGKVISWTKVFSRKYHQPKN